MLNNLTHDILTQYGPFNLGNLTIVFPTRRAGMQLTELLRTELEQRNIRRPILAPQITTLSEFFDSLSTLGREDELRLVAILYAIYCDLTNPSPSLKGGRGDCIPFETFFPWGRRLITDFSNIDKGYPDVDPIPFLTHTTSAHDLEVFKLDDEVRERLQELIADTVLSQLPEASVRSAYDQIWQLLPELYTRFHEALRERTYEGARMKEVLLHWDTPRVQDCLRGRHFIFAGFNYIVPAERELMLRLKAREQATFYWDYPANFACNPKAFKWVRNNAEKVIASNQYPVEAWQPREVELLASDSVNAEARYVRQWLMEHHHKGDRTAIVLCDETLLQDVIASLPEDDGTGRFARINITKGFPIAHTPIFAEMMAFLSDPRNEKKPDETYASVIDRLIDFLPRPTQTTEPTEPTETTEPAEWTTLLAREAYYRLLLALNRFRLLLDEPSLMPLRSLASLRRLVKRYVQSISLPFHGEPIADIQVLGVLETRTLDFDNLLLLSVEEGVVPQVKEEDSFIPFFLRKVYGMPTTEEATDVYAYNFFRLLRRPKQVTICYCGSESKYNRKSPSRFIMQMMASPDFTLLKRVIIASGEIQTDSVLSEGPKPTFRSLFHRDNDGFLCHDDDKRLLLSPSAIDAYLTCPRKFYYRYIRGLDTPPKTAGTFTRAEYGSFVHNLIQLVYEKLNADRKITQQTPLKITAELLNSVTDEQLSDLLDDTYLAMNEEFKQHYGGDTDHYIRSQHEMENPNILAAVRNIMQQDARLAEAGLTIIEQERYVSFHIDIPGENGVERLNLGGRIDRVDTCSGITRIVDYKTGAADDNKLTIPASPDEYFKPNTKPGYWLQTLIYTAAWCSHLNSQQSTVNCQLSYGFSRSFEASAEIRTINCQPSTINCQPSTVNCQLSTIIAPYIYFPRDPESVCHPVHKEKESSLDFAALCNTFIERLKNQLSTMFSDTVYELVPVGKCDSFCPFFNNCGRKPPEY